MKFSLKFLFVLILVLSSSVPFFSNTHVQAVSAKINLSFTPNDVAMDETKPIVYMTKLGSKTLYAVNYSTGGIKTLTLPYEAERLDLKNNQVQDSGVI
ncbi:hypothetical protein [Niallia sp. 03133]|uniref:hypothetical protein n=1 Tax=Niallia sp. 03133 TaxID=3458060 RepID=UPI004044BEB3